MCNDHEQVNDILVVIRRSGRGEHRKLIKVKNRDLQRGDNDHSKGINDPGKGIYVSGVVLSMWVLVAGGELVGSCLAKGLGRKSGGTDVRVDVTGDSFR